MFESEGRSFSHPQTDRSTSHPEYMKTKKEENTSRHQHMINSFDQSFDLAKRFSRGFNHN